MLECEQSGTVTLGISADAPVKGGRAAQGVVPLAPARTVARYLSRSRSRQSRALSVRLIIARLPLANMPKLFVR
jgi:hypothetical protein